MAAIACLFGVVMWYAASEVHHAKTATPAGVVTVRDFFHRFGEPRRVQLVSHRGAEYYCFTGRLPLAWSLAIPSGPPVYIFDANGNFVTWCLDPADRPKFQRDWPLLGAGDVAVGAVREKFVP